MYLSGIKPPDIYNVIRDYKCNSLRVNHRHLPTCMTFPNDESTYTLTNTKAPDCLKWLLISRGSYVICNSQSECSIRKCPELDGNSFASLPVRLKYKQICLIAYRLAYGIECLTVKLHIIMCFFFFIDYTQFLNKDCSVRSLN